MQAANTGSSTNANSYAAGQEAAAKARAGLSDVKLAFAYASVANDLDQMLKGIREELPGIPVIGNTSFTGVIMPEGFVGGENGFVGILTLSDEDPAVGVAGLPKAGNARETDKAIVQKAMQSAEKSGSPDYFYMVAPSGEEQFRIKSWHLREFISGVLPIKCR